MRKSDFTHTQIAFILRQAEESTKVEQVCRKMRFSMPRVPRMQIRQEFASIH